MKAIDYYKQLPDETEVIDKSRWTYGLVDLFTFAEAFHLNEVRRIQKELEDFKNTEQNETT